MIRKANKNDIEKLIEMALVLYEGSTYEDLYPEFFEILSLEKDAFFVAEIKDNIIGFSQVSLRYEYVEGTNTSPVGYLEGIYIEEEYRHMGIGRKLLKYCEKFAKDRGCTQFASDSEMTNIESYDFHTSVGFIVTNRIVCYIKEI